MILVVSSAVFVGILRKDPHQYPLVYMRGGAGHSRLRGRERRAAARAAIKIGLTTEETVNVNETTSEPVEETEPAENAEISEKSVNAAEK